MREPQRLQRSRAKGWRKPEGSVIVARPSRWGNMFYVDYPLHREDAVRCYRDLIVEREAWFSEPDTEFGPGARHRWTSGYRHFPVPTVEQVIAELGGRDLICYCPLLLPAGERCPCHADVLLELANPDIVFPWAAAA